MAECKLTSSYPNYIHICGPMAPLFLSFTQSSSLSILSLFLFSLQLLWLSQPSSSLVAHSNTSSASCPHHQKAALLQLKNGFFIERGIYNSSSRLDSWNQATDCCLWKGITCDVATGLVIELDLSSSYDIRSSRIEGRIDSSLFHLWSLQKLDLSYNDFYLNPIPSRLGQLTNLTHLNFSSCVLVGQIPLEISQLTKLVSLDLSYNAGLEIKNPNLAALLGNFSSLEELFLDYVNISKLGGEWTLALSSTVPNLRILSLRYCGLSGPNNPSLFKGPFLSELSLDGNNFSLNAVLNLLEQSSSLTSLTLSDCGLCGKFPESVFLLQDLQKLDISKNSLLTINLPKFPKNSVLRELRMGYTNLQEKLPESIGNLKFLEELSLSNCNLSGFLPSSIANLTQLKLLDLSSNNFRGPIPSHLFSHPSLYYLLLEYNNFDNLFDDIQNASSSLKAIYLNENKLQGPIPSIIYNSVEVQFLDLSYNNFSGTVEWLNMFQNFWNLQSLDLSYNNFSGTIELLSIFQSFKNLWNLDLSSNSLSVINSINSSNLTSSPQIQYLWLSSCNMNEFPSTLRSLKQLRSLDLSNNKIHGEISSWIWEVGNRALSFLNLSHNFLESFEHPRPDLSFSQLYYIDLHSNRLQGSIPNMPPTVQFQDYSKNNFSSIMPNAINLTFVYSLFISDNHISGEIPLSLCNASYLRAFDLSSNNFSGRIPECLGEISDSLEILNLQKNSFHGMLPQSFKKECSLRILNVQENQFEGPLPRSLANCKNLEVLDLRNNQINDTFPFWLKGLSHLRILILRSNKFNGPITHSHMNYPLFPLLQIFDISSNYFMGLFPSNLFLNWKAMMGDDSHLGSDHQFGRYDIWKNRGLYYQDSVTVTMKGLDMEVVKITLTTLISIDISNNRFERRIEESIGDMKSLYVLNFSQNDFTGPIPPSLGKLTQLESLDLSRNKLSGEIPKQLLKLTFLAVLNLSQNLLNGSIPQGQQFLTFTNDSFLGNRGLCGPPLSTKCEDMGASPPSDFESFGSNKDGEIDLRMMWIGFGVGFGVVFWTLVFWRKGSRKFKQLTDGVFQKLLL